VIRRLITRSGKSRAFLNGNVVTLGMLEEISGELVNIYGQHEHQHFLEPKRHIDILDGAGDLLSRRRSYEELYGQWRQAAGELEDWTRRQQQRRERMELLAFQSQEISRARLQEPRPGEPNEEETLTAERARLVHAEKLFEIAHQGFETLYGESGSVIERLKGTRQRLREGEKIDSSLSPFRQALETAVLQAEDAASSLRSYRDKIHFDPMRLEEIESRLDEIRKLKRKYGGSLEEVLAYKKKLDEERKSLETLEEKIAETQTRVDHFYRQEKNRPQPRCQGGSRIGRLGHGKGEIPDSPGGREPASRRACVSPFWRNRAGSGGIFSIPESRRGFETAGENRLGRRVVPDHARAEKDLHPG